MKKLYFIILIVLTIISCETREDINQRRNTPPEIFVGKYDKDINLLELADTLKRTDSSTYYFSSVDDSSLDLTYMLELDISNESSSIKDSVEIILDEKTKQIKVQSNLNDKTINNIEHSFSIYIIAVDNFGLTAKAKISIKLLENRPPIPQVTFNELSSTEYEISADESVDPDGDKIIAYEYLIDGKVIYNKAGYEGEYETVANPNPGHAGTGGTYIISTPLSSIKHNFQVENVNDFKIYVRVKDEQGLWSSWSQFSL